MDRNTINKRTVTPISENENWKMKMIDEVHWVPTSEQLSDFMTKRGQNSGWMLIVGIYNRLDLKIILKA